MSWSIWSSAIPLWSVGWRRKGIWSAIIRPSIRICPESLEKVYADCTGREMAPFYRPPEGRFSKQNLRYAEEEGYTTVFWSYAYADWDNNRQPDPERAIAQILAHTHPGMVILLHPTSATNAKIMDRLLTAWEQDGYRFGSLEELRK